MKFILRRNEQYISAVLLDWILLVTRYTYLRRSFGHYIVLDYESVDERPTPIPEEDQAIPMRFHHSNNCTVIWRNGVAGFVCYTRTTFGPRGLT